MVPNESTSRRRGPRGDVLRMIGTTKGAFLLWSTTDRKRWRIDAPHFPGESVFAMAFDSRGGRQRLFASTNTWQHGSVVRSSDDFGHHWTPSDKKIVRHPHRPNWFPGGGGLCLHTVALDPGDPRRMLVGISTGGVYRSDDAGASWRPSNIGLSAEFMPDNKFPEFGQCGHKFVAHPALRGRRQAPRLPDAQCRDELGAAHARASAATGVRDRRARRLGRRLVRDLRSLFWHAKRQALRIPG